MRIGIYGGSFNPIHIGHEQIANFVVENLNLDKLIIIPVGIPSHKKDRLEEADIRFNFCKKVFSNNDKIEVSDIEIKNNETSYTYDTLKKIIKLYGNEHKYFEIIGEDSLKNFSSWKNYKDILKLSTLVVLKRRSENSIEQTFDDDNLIYLDNPFYDVSSTEIRRRIKNNEDISSLVNKIILDDVLREMKDNV